MSNTDKNNDIMQDPVVMEKLKSMGWVPDQNPAVQAITRVQMNKMADSIRSLVEHAHANNQMSSLWVHQRSSWEQGTDDEVSDTRKSFMAACTRHGSEARFIEDSQKRWEKAEFTAITLDWYVVGSVASPRSKKCTLPLKSERDDEAPGVDAGRDSVTYLVYPTIKSSISGVRMKIDGDRFTVQQREGRCFLVGFKEFELKEHPGFTVVERYAGTFYVISPVEWTYQSIRLKDGDQFVMADFKPHPFMAIEDVPKHHFTSSKYEGIMLRSGNREYRAKWRATAEILVDGVVWEVVADSLNTTFPFKLLRPRPGKIPSTEGAALTQMNSCLPGKAIVPVLRTSSEIKSTTSKILQEGSKCFFLHRTFDAFYVIRDGEKPFDLIGGTIEQGENAVQAMVREVFEETRMKMEPSQFFLLGDSIEETDKYIWKSNVFIAIAPPQFDRHPSIFMEQKTIGTYRRSMLEDKKRYQVWLNRLLMFVEGVGDFTTLRTLLVASGLTSPFKKMGISTTIALDIFSRIGPNKLIEALYHEARQSRQHYTFDSFFKYVSVFCYPISSLSEWEMQVSKWFDGYNRRSISSSSTAVPEVEAEENDASAVHAYPSSKIVAQNLLKEIFGEHNTVIMLAQDLYRAFSQKRYPGTRAAKIKFMKNCEIWGIVTSANSIVGGRKFTLV